MKSHDPILKEHYMRAKASSSGSNKPSSVKALKDAARKRISKSGGSY